MTNRQIALELFHEDMTAERIKMVARVQAKRQGKAKTLSIRKARAFKYAIQGR